LAAAVAMLVYWVVLARDAGAPTGAAVTSGWATLGAFPAVVCAMLPLARFFEGLGMRPEPLPVLLAAATALQAAVGRIRDRAADRSETGPTPAWPHNAYIGGAAPVLVVYGLIWSWAWISARSIAWATAFLLLSFVSRWQRQAARAP
jgi:hypothetical protein